MSKRTRGSARAHRRPGARPASSRPLGPRPLRPAPLEGERPTPTDDDALEAAVLSVESDAAVRRPADVAAAAPVRSVHHRPRAKPGSVLASRAATEYVYVGQDLRRILLVSSLLLGAMIAAWLAIAVLRIIPLDFY